MKLNLRLRLLGASASVALLSIITTGCGAAYTASSGSKFEIDSGKEIDDSDVGKAFAASPQMGERVKVAYYTFDDAHVQDIERTLAQTPNVASVYRIPALLVTGKRRFHESSPYASPQEVGIKKLRLLAARAHADVLVVFDHGWRGGGLNGWAATIPLIIPIFFVPMVDNETESYAEAYVIDVRNGFLYGEVSAEQKSGGASTIYASGAEKIAMEEQWPKLLASIKTELTEKLKPTLTAAKAEAPQPTPAPPPTP